MAFCSIADRLITVQKRREAAWRLLLAVEAIVFRFSVAESLRFEGIRYSG
jgi:hypothetical protein